MAQDNQPDLQVEAWLKTLGIESLCQWDVLVFLYRHQSSLLSADHIALVLSYANAEVVAALDSVESSGLVERSRVPQGVRLYQLTLPADSRLGDALNRLMALTDSRAGRLLLSKKLPQGDQSKTRPPPLGLEQKGVTHG